VCGTLQIPLEDYLKLHDDLLVRQRIVAIRNGARGID